MTRIDLCINSQTPPLLPRPGVVVPDGRVWHKDRDYTLQIGGVVPMMRALLGHGLDHWIRRPARWIALGGPDFPPEIRTDEGYTLETIQLADEERRRYVRFKEAIWRSFHGPRGFRPPAADYRGFVAYGYRTALRLLNRIAEHDLFYVNDFQQILVGGLVGPAAPVLLRWHIPLDFRGYPEPVSRFFLKAMEGFDGIVVSTRAGLEELFHVGYQGRAYQLYPYFDPREQPEAKPAAVAQFAERLHLGDGPVIVAVGRMDPMKRQDLLIEAIARVRRHHPDVRCVLVGGGSFSTSAGGLRSSKAVGWRRYLEQRVHDLGLTAHVQFTGTVDAADLASAYGAADVFVHPAPWEGFGLVAVEAWTHGRPVVVSRGAGVAELVSNGINGYAVTPGRSAALAEAILELLDHPERAQKMGQNGIESAQRCHVDRAGPRLKEIFERTIEMYDRSGLRAGRRPRGWRP